MTIGKRIKKLRCQKMNMSQVSFADSINVSKQTLYKYENDIVTNIPADKIEAIASLCNVSPAYLMGWEDEEMMATLTAAAEDAVLNAQISKDEDLKRMIKMFIALPEDKKKTIRQIVEDYYNTFA